jgi:hypothetical protein
MTRSATFTAILLLAAFAGVTYADAQTILAAAEPGAATESYKITDVLLVFATAALVWVTWILAKSTKGLQKSAEIQGKDMQKSLDLTRDSMKFASGQLESANAQRAKNLGDQLFEFDKLLISHPALQVEIEKLRAAGAGLGKAVKDDDFVKLKSFIYMHLNFFDEIISTYEGTSVTTVEYQDWCTYIIEKMKHPAYKDVMDTERHIFGAKLRQFFEDHKKEIYNDNGKAWEW